MATKWEGEITCRWCGYAARAGIEKDGLGRTYRVMCETCGVTAQVGFDTIAGDKIARLLGLKDISNDPNLPRTGRDGPPVIGWLTLPSGEIWILTLGVTSRQVV